MIPQAATAAANLKSWQSHAGFWLKAAVAIGFTGGLLLVAQAWLVARIVDAVVFGAAGLADMTPWLIWLLALFLPRAGLTWAAERTAFRAALQVKLTLRERLYRHIQALGPAWLADERSGDVLTTLSDGIEALEAYYARYLPAMALAALLPLCLLAFVFPADWLSGLILLLTAPVIPLFMILIGKGAERRNQRQWQRLARLSAHFLDVIQGLTTLRLFDASRREAAMVARLSDQYRASTMSVLRIAFLSALVLEFFATVSIAIVAVLIGFRLLWGDMSFLHGFFVLLLAPEFYLPLRNLGAQYHARMQAIGAAERIVGILETPVPERRDMDMGMAATIPDLRRVPMRCASLDFVYPDGRQALRGLDLVVQPGETLALVGASGAGKTTLINLLLGFLPEQEGCIYIGASRLRDLDLAAWRKQLAWLPQRPQLFSCTVADNIRLGDPHASHAVVENAARQAQAHDFIAALPQGYETPVGEGGHGLSGGQTQRIALARAFLRDAPLVILDEAAAHLDKESAALVHEGLRQLARGRTVIMIAHRLHSVRHADRIAVIDHGRIVQTGTHADLSASCDAYRNMLAALEDEAI